MGNNLIQPFLQAGLIDIGDSDERLANIEQSIADLQKKFEDEYSLLPAYTLVGLDPEIPADEQTVIDTESIIASHWKALRAKFSERPISIIRAVILNALYNVGLNDPYAARIIYLTATNFYPYAKLGRESEIIKRIIAELGDLAEQNAVQEWSLVDEGPGLSLKTLKIDSLQFGMPEINEDELKAGFLAAIRNDPSGHGTNHGGNSQWGNHFAANASAAVSKALNNSFQSIDKVLSPASIETPINKYFADFKKALDAVLKNSFNSIRTVERRSKLLWWKETLYSSSIKNSYRVLDVNVQPIIMARDLYDQLPEITPVSVDFLLKDTLLLLNTNANVEITFGHFLTEIEKIENKTILKDYLKIGKENGRMSITDFFALIVNDRTSSSMFKQYTGVSESETVSLANIAVIALHDFLTSYLVSE